uniref:Cation-transporting P-type ATPase N-terminal domain-containing protein n=1 Tax=Astatotilapia calliptera TaxID=8154 RepID=A0A3P8NGV9_ASTCA
MLSVYDKNISMKAPYLKSTPGLLSDLQGYKWVSWRVWLCRLGFVLSLGLLWIAFYWWPRFAVLVHCSSCPPALADVLILKDSSGQQSVVEVLTEEVEEGRSALSPVTLSFTCLQKTLLRYYLFEELRYIWVERKGAFCRVSSLHEDWTCSKLYDFQSGLSPQEQSSRRSIYGPNLINVPVKPWIRLLFEEILNPFYVFQLFGIVLWISDNYYYYATVVLVLSAGSIVYSLYETRRQSITLHNMARLVTDVTIRRKSGAKECVSSIDLVPGDCLIIPQKGLLLPCDAVLLVGECLVDESMLTGESVPELKTPLQAGDRQYRSDTEHRHTLFSGTKIIQAKCGKSGDDGAVAVVTNTGFFTAKGHLVSSILHPQPINFRFHQDAGKFLLLLGIVALCGSIYIFVALYKQNATWQELIVRTLDIVTIAVPPALPLAMTAGAIYAQKRLKKQGIYCIDPPRINVCGKVSLFCFDKTGTLTEGGMNVEGVIEGGPGGFSELVHDPSLLLPKPLLFSLACCHTLTLLEGQPQGDPLELKMVESTGWTLHEPEGDGNVVPATFGRHKVLALMRPPTQSLQNREISAVALVQRFPFSSGLQRMSVVTVAHGWDSALAFMKGSPEMVISLCRPETVPAQFSSKLRKYTSEGLRVLALAYKQVDVDSDLNNIEREEVEKEMYFLGFLMMKNLLKPESAGVIDVLRNVNIRSVMVTGDNLMTAVNVAKSCKMVGSDENVIFVTATAHTDQAAPTLKFRLENQGTNLDQCPAEVITQILIHGPFDYHLAIDGKSFAALCDHFPEYLPKVLMRATIFARTVPEQKTQLVKELQNLGYRVGMCGDGANDCGALRAADVGISLSEAEASVAAPFTSKTENITCVPQLIREGRCSLVTSFSLFRYMSLYSLVQFCSVIILCTVKTTLGDFQFLYFDFILVTLLAIVMGRGGPSEELHTFRPPANLLNLPILVSLFIHTCMIILGQVAALLITTSQKWYIPLNSTVFETDNLPNMEDTSVFDLSGFQYIIMAVVVTKGYPHKKPICQNRLFLLVLFSQLCLMLWLVLHPLPAFFLQLYDISDMVFKVVLVGVAAINFLICFLVEILIDCGCLNCFRRLWNRSPSKKQYKRLLPDLRFWQPLDENVIISEAEN